MGRIIAVANQKGGVGKTTTATNLSACLAEKGKKVLAIDIDPQGNMTSGLGVDKNQLDETVYDLILDECTLEDCLQKDVLENLALIPSNVNLAGAEIEFIGVEDKEFILKEAVDQVKEQYDFIIIDCPPSLGILTTNALAAADSVLIPVQCEYYALEGIMQLINTIMLAQRKVNPNLDIEGVLLTMLSVNTNLGLEVISSIKEFFKERVYDTIIPRLIKLAEAPSHGKTIIDYDPKGKGTKAYLNLAKEVIDRNGTKEESAR